MGLAVWRRDDDRFHKDHTAEAPRRQNIEHGYRRSSHRVADADHRSRKGKPTHQIDQVLPERPPSDRYVERPAGSMTPGINREDCRPYPPCPQTGDDGSPYLFAEPGCVGEQQEKVRRSFAPFEGRVFHPLSTDGW